MTNKLLPTGGNYRKLFCYQKAEAIYDITYYFCKHYLQRGDRTIDQMIQAARSGKQNIVEGSAASTTSKEMEIKLINVAKASLHELLIDYEDYLRTREYRRLQISQSVLLSKRIIY
ncbi:four helix bundle protein [Parabacteroides sp. PF5-9]|nr:four helix bundle protein [Parabacteroides sp. PF5-9]